jgi:hypothetical protein
MFLFLRAPLFQPPFPAGWKRKITRLYDQLHAYINATSWRALKEWVLGSFSPEEYLIPVLDGSCSALITKLRLLISDLTSRSNVVCGDFQANGLSSGKALKR